MNEFDREQARDALRRMQDREEVIEAWYTSGAVFAGTQEEAYEILQTETNKRFADIYTEVTTDQADITVDEATFTYNYWRTGLVVLSGANVGLSEEEDSLGILDKLKNMLGNMKDLLVDILSHRTNILPEQFKLKADLELAEQADEITSMMKQHIPDISNFN